MMIHDARSSKHLVIVEMWFGGRRRGSYAKGSRVPGVRIGILFADVQDFPVVILFRNIKRFYVSKQV